MDLNALADFALVAAHGGFGKASRASGRSKATLSRRVADLETALGVRLLERGTNRLALTEAGQLLLDRAEAPLHEVADAITAAREGLAVPRGRLRVAAPLLFSQLALGKLGARFIAAYPEVQLEVVAEDRVVDLIDEHFDVAIRPNPRPDTTLVGKCFAKDTLVIAAAPSIPMPKSAGNEPIPVAAVVMPSNDNQIWPINAAGCTLEPRPVLRLSSLLMVRDAVVAGAGAGLLPRSIIGHQLDTGQLVQWGTTGKEVELWILHTSRRLLSPKVRAFVDFMYSAYPLKVLVLDGPVPS